MVLSTFSPFFSEATKQKIADNWSSLSPEAKAEIARLDEQARSYEDFIVTELMPPK